MLLGLSGSWYLCRRGMEGLLGERGMRGGGMGRLPRGGGLRRGSMDVLPKRREL